MGLPSCQYDHARYRHGPCRRHDRAKAQTRLRRRANLAACITLCCAWLWPVAALADTLRIATYHVELERRGPGILLRDLRKGNDPQIAAVAEVIATNQPDILVLQGVDHDMHRLALTAFANTLRDYDIDYPYAFAGQTNRGLATGLDLNGDRKTGTSNDTLGHGDFYGQGAMAILSKYPIRNEAVQDYTALIWRDIPWATLPTTDGAPFPSTAAQEVQTLSSGGHWAVPITLPDGTNLTILTFHATPPVFDGPEDMNGKRNADEILFWQHYLDGTHGPAPAQRFVVAGVANLDPADSDGSSAAIMALLNDPRLRNLSPRSTGGTANADPNHKGDPSLDTAVFAPPKGPGNIRTDYVIPSADWRVLGSGVYWPEGNETVATASRHRLVWVDLDY